MNSYEPLKTVDKALKVLSILNTKPFMRVRDLAELTRIPKSTLVRILETLVHLGYLRQIDRLSGYCITDKVQSLSAGYHGLPRILENVQARADQMTAEFGWPTSVATLDGDAMIVRYSTIPQSPLAHIHSTINRRLSLNRRAHGRVYLAFCPQEEREHLLRILQNKDPSLGLDLIRLGRELVQINANGYARRLPDVQPQTSTLAAPVWVEGRLVATFGVTFFANSVPDPIHLIRCLIQKKNTA